ncbi:MAG: hypothetical protein ACYSU0_21030 [Planctomycetota bacterium]
MTDDPIVREIREIRKALSEECGHDVRRLGEMIREWQKESGREYVSPRKKAGTGDKPS